MPLTEDVAPLPVPAAAPAPTAAATAKPGQSSGRKRSASSRMVGASPEELDSIKELIHFDHVYYKQEDGSSSAGTADVVMEDASTTVAAAVTALAAPSPATLVLTSAPVSPASVIEVEDTVVVIDDCPSPLPGSPDSAPFDLNSVCAESGDAQGSVHPPQEALSLPPSLKMAASPSAHSTETGYESALSPLSDCSFREDSLFDDSPPWVDPLSELFPALV